MFPRESAAGATLRAEEAEVVIGEPVSHQGLWVRAVVGSFPPERVGLLVFMLVPPDREG